MKARPDLNPRDAEVQSSPDNYYIDSQGHVNELEDDEERILFGTVANPKPDPETFVVDWAPLGDTLPVEPVEPSESWFQEAPPPTPEDRLWKEAERDIARAMNPETNPHLKAVETIMGALGLDNPLFQRPKDAHIVPIGEEEDEDDDS